MQILRGRGFAENADREGAPRVAVINETLAHARTGGAQIRLAAGLSAFRLGRAGRPVLRGRRGPRLEVQLFPRQPSQPDELGPQWRRHRHQSCRNLADTEPGEETVVARRAEELLRATDPDVMLRSTTTLAAQVAGRLRGKGCCSSSHRDSPSWLCCWRVSASTERSPTWSAAARARSVFDSRSAPDGIGSCA